MCTICGAPTRANPKAAMLMLSEWFYWEGKSWYADTDAMTVSDMHDALRGPGGMLRNSPDLAASVSSGGTFTILKADGDMSYTVVNSGNQSRLYRDVL